MEWNYDCHSAPPPLPRHWLSKNLTTAWLRLGKAAVFSVLAGLAVAGGLVFSGGEAEAQGAQGGYIYTSRVCQEYGQQPRWYNVRDGQAAYNGGNSDSGWLIVLEHGSHISYTITLGTYTSSAPTVDDPANGVAPRRVTDISTGVSAFIRYDRGAQRFLPPTGGSQNAVLDGNDDGVFNSADLVPNQYNPAYYHYRTAFYESPQGYGTSYVRWAHMAWCR